MTELGKGRAEAISDADIAALADDLDCHPADLEAIAETESNGFGWFNDGRIKILFEKHWFYKFVSGATRTKAVAGGLARQAWVSPAKGGYKDQASSDDRYRVLQAAIDLAGREPAMKSISIGRFQIMGFNYAICGFSSAGAMFDAFCDSERNQLKAFASFLKDKGLVPALRARDFDRIEKVYNGGGLGGAYARKMRQNADELRKGKWKGYVAGNAAAPKPSPVPPAPKPAPELGGATEPVQQPPKPITPTTKQTGIGALILALLIGFGSQAREAWSFIWPWGLMGIAIAVVVSIFFWRRAHYKPNTEKNP